MKAPNILRLIRPANLKRAFRAYDGNRVLFTVYGADEQQALEAAMDRCLDEGIGYLDNLHACEV